LEGAAWNKSGKYLEESAPKDLFPQFPILLVSAQSTAPVQGGPGIGKAKQDDKSSEKSMYSCPVYKYPKRTDRYLIFRVNLKSDG